MQQSKKLHILRKEYKIISDTGILFRLEKKNNVIGNWVFDDIQSLFESDKLYFELELTNTSFYEVYIHT